MKPNNKTQKRILGYYDVTDLQVDIFYFVVSAVLIGGLIWRALTL
jgi:hypothetical protein